MYCIGSDKWPGLSKIIEESGEVQQVAGKIIANEGNLNHWDGSKLDDRLEEELGDLFAAMNFLIDMNRLNLTKIQERRDAKLALFHKWHKAALK